MGNIENIFEKLFAYYKVGNTSDLAKKIGSSPSTISNWRQRKSINAIKKKCRELGIYQQIFTDTIDLTNKKAIEYKNINVKLNQFNRRTLVYLYYLLKKTNINNSIEYFDWNMHKDDETTLTNFISDFFVDLKNNNVTFANYRNELNDFIDIFLSIDELDYILENKEIFIKVIFFLTEQKR